MEVMPRAAAAAHGTGALGAVGICFGGRYAAELGGGAAAAAGFGADAVAIIHPGGCPAEAAAALQVPSFWGLVESDAAFPAAAVAAAKAALAAKAEPLRGTFSVFAGPGVRHGFFSRGPPSAAAERSRCIGEVADFFARELASK